MSDAKQQHSQNVPIDNENHEKALNDSGRPAHQLVISKDSVSVRLTCLFLLCFQNCTAVLAIKNNSRIVAEDGLKSLSTVVIVVVSRSVLQPFDVMNQIFDMRLTGRAPESDCVYSVLVGDKSWIRGPVQRTKI